MCGIIGFTGEEDAYSVLIHGLKKMEYRGYDSAGVAILRENSIEFSKSVGYVSALQEKIENIKKTNPLFFDGACGIGHTRWATHGAALEKNAHPHISNDKKFAVCHNGIIENFAALKAKLQAENYEFYSETDTEVIVALLQKNYRGDFKKAFELTLENLEGSYAIAAICVDYPDVIYVAKKNAPLIIGINKDFNIFASDIMAIMAMTKDVIYLDDDQYAQITPSSMTIFLKGGSTINPKVEKIQLLSETAEKGGYDHFMLKEIMEQDKAIGASLGNRMGDGRVVLDGFSLDAHKLKTINRIIVTACGSAYYAGSAAKFALEKCFSKPVSVELASELRYSETKVDEGTLLIAISQSGETADTIAAIKECKRCKAHVVSVVNVVASTVAKLSDDILYTYAGSEIAVATTKGYTTQLAVLYALSLYAAQELNTLSKTEFDELYNQLSLVPEKVKATLQLESFAKNLAPRLANNPSVFFLGRNTDYAVAMEGALKLKEISYIHAESYASGELKHGSIALIDEGTEVIAICCNARLFEKSMSNCLEVMARGARVHIISSEKIDNDNIALKLPAIADVFSPILAVIPLQLIAYYVALLKNCNIDKPRNLAKSVTVE